MGEPKSSHVTRLPEDITRQGIEDGLSAWLQKYGYEETRAHYSRPSNMQKVLLLNVTKVRESDAELKTTRGGVLVVSPFVLTGSPPRGLSSRERRIICGMR